MQDTRDESGEGAAVLAHEGIEFRFEAIGSGEPVILLHGLGGDRRQAFKLLNFRGARCIAIDLRGHGETEPVGPSGGFTFATLAADVGALADSLGLGIFALVGVSMGAGVALRVALGDPGRVAALVLVRPAWIDRPLTENLTPFVEIAKLLKGAGPERGRRIFEQSERLRSIRRVSPYAAESLCEQFAKPWAAERAVRLERMPRSTPYASGSELRRLRVPVLVIGCDQDPVHPLPFAEAWAAHLGARLLRVISKTMSAETHDAAVRSAVTQFLIEACSV
jgi:pimeloyl-ACP methyl ester carboxylesterase